MDCRVFWGSPFESVILDHHRIDGAVLGADVVLWSDKVGEGVVSSMVGSTSVGRFAYLYRVFTLYDHQRAGGFGSALLEALQKKSIWKRRMTDELRAAAALALSLIGGEDAIKSLETAAEDNSELVARAATKALKQLKRNE